MSAAQEIIRDRLVVATISRGWQNGPLHIAAQALDPAFELADNKYNRREHQLLGAMKWPRLFGLAFHGANAGLAEEEDRRALALAVFEKVAPRTRYQQTPVRLTCEMAIWMAVRAHVLACSDTCPLHRAVAAYLKEYQPDKGAPYPLWKAADDSLEHCLGYTGSPHAAVKLASTAAHSAVVACRFLLLGLLGAMRPPKTQHCADAARNAARTEAMVGGVRGAVELCLEVAKRLGL
jgi:hypothetical protein